MFHMGKMYLLRMPGKESLYFKGPVQPNIEAVQSHPSRIGARGDTLNSPSKRLRATVFLPTLGFKQGEPVLRPLRSSHYFTLKDQCTARVTGFSFNQPGLGLNMHDAHLDVFMESLGI